MRKFEKLFPEIKFMFGNFSWIAFPFPLLYLHINVFIRPADSLKMGIILNGKW